jgi:hypothetical protein
MLRDGVVGIASKDACYVSDSRGRKEVQSEMSSVVEINDHFVP